MVGSAVALRDLGRGRERHECVGRALDGPDLEWRFKSNSRLFWPIPIAFRARVRVRKWPPNAPVEVEQSGNCIAGNFHAPLQPGFPG